jgi:hypothetical protein
MDDARTLAEFTAAHDMRVLLTGNDDYRPTRLGAAAMKRLASSDAAEALEAARILQALGLDLASRPEIHTSVTLTATVSNEHLLTALQSSDPVVAVKAAEVLIYSNDHQKEAVEAVLKHFSACYDLPDQMTRSSAVWVLTRRGDGNPAALRAVLTALYSPVTETRRLSVYGVSRAAREGPVPAPILDAMEYIAKHDPVRQVSYPAALVYVRACMQAGASFDWLVAQAAGPCFGIPAAGLPNVIRTVAFGEIAYASAESEARVKARWLIYQGLRSSSPTMMHYSLGWIGGLVDRKDPMALTYQTAVGKLKQHPSDVLKHEARQVLQAMDEMRRPLE